jgi:hypothetical protein
MPNARATFEPPSLGVAVTVAELPADSVVALAVIVGVVPLVPLEPDTPAGMPKDSVRFPASVVPVTVALEPAARVVVFPTVTLVAGPAGIPMSSLAANAVPRSFFTYACEPAARVVTLLMASVPETTVALPGEIVPSETLTAPPLPTVALTVEPPDTATFAAPAFVTVTLMLLMEPSEGSRR